MMARSHADTLAPVLGSVLTTDLGCPIPPDFPSMLMALASFMRLSLMKAAHVAVAWGRVQEIRVSRSFFCEMWDTAALSLRLFSEHQTLDEGHGFTGC